MVGEKKHLDDSASNKQNKIEVIKVELDKNVHLNQNKTMLHSKLRKKMF